MTERLVYRIEDADGYGPFQNPEARDVIDVEHYNADQELYPTPANDPGFNPHVLARKVFEQMTPDHLWEIGCCSPEQLQHWFDETVCKGLAALGFLYAIFRVDDNDVLEGKWQAVFDRENAECIERKPATALFDAA